jgi:L-threonylcarbamoyladenylate synthase
MKTIKVNLKRSISQEVALIVSYLRQGKVVVLPTDSSYALCVNALNPPAVQKIYNLKGRPISQPMHVFVKDISMAKKLAVFDQRADNFFHQYLPGAITLVLPAKLVVPKILTAGKFTVGIRYIAADLFKQIFKKINFPLTATSANLSGQSSFFKIKELVKDFSDLDTQPDLVVDSGRLPFREPSTVVELLPDGKLKIWRQGAVKINSKIKIQSPNQN